MDNKFLNDTGTEMIRLVKATLSYYRKFSGEAIKGENISFCGMQILTTLRYYPECDTVSDIADSLNVSKGLISREVEELRKAGYVETRVDSKDRRVLRISMITEKALPIVKKQKEKLFSFIFQMAEGMTEEDIVELRRLNSILYANSLELDLEKSYDVSSDIDEILSE